MGPGCWGSEFGWGACESLDRGRARCPRQGRSNASRVQVWLSGDQDQPSLYGHAGRCVRNVANARTPLVGNDLGRAFLNQICTPEPSADARGASGWESPTSVSNVSAQGHRVDVSCHMWRISLILSEGRSIRRQTLRFLPYVADFADPVQTPRSNAGRPQRRRTTHTTTPKTAMLANHTGRK